MAILLLVVLAIINFIIYHKFFRVIYFGNMGPQLVAEMAMCFIVAAFELVILAGVLNTAVGAVGFVGGILLGIVKFIFKLILAGVIILVILLILSSMLPEKEDDKKIENSVAQNEVENEEIIKNEEIVEVKDISENESESQEQKDSEKKSVFLNIIKIIIIGVLIYCLIALFSNKEKNAEKVVNNNVVEQQSTETIVEENRDYEESDLEDTYVEVYEDSFEKVEQEVAIVNPIDFLNNKEVCWYINENRMYYFSEILYGLEEGMDVNNIRSYVLLDMDKDGSKEIILELSGQYDDYYLIMNYSEELQQNIVITKGIREFRDLTLDGVYMASNGADSWFYCTMNLTDVYNIIEEIIASANNGYFEVYGESVSEEAFNQFCENIYSNGSPSWNSFVAETFADELGISGEILLINDENDNLVENDVAEYTYIPEGIISDDEFIEYYRIAGLYYGIGESYASINMYSSYDTEFVGNIEIDGEVTLWGELIPVGNNLYQIVTESENNVFLGVYTDNGTIYGNLYINGQDEGIFRMEEQFAPPQ